MAKVKELVRVIIDPRDPTHDYWISRSAAERLFNRGVMGHDESHDWYFTDTVTFIQCSQKVLERGRRGQ